MMIACKHITYLRNEYCNSGCAMCGSEWYCGVDYNSSVEWSIWDELERRLKNSYDVSDRRCDTAWLKTLWKFKPKINNGSRRRNGFVLDVRKRWKCRPGRWSYGAASRFRCAGSGLDDSPISARRCQCSQRKVFYRSPCRNIKQNKTRFTYPHQSVAI